ncbi:MAG: ATP-binding protein [Caulobacteraceae bacterium]|nr:ATP-binding protein [Caulobacteraceae bacterium]
MFDLAEAVEPVAPETPGSVIYDRFQTDPNLLNIAVADAKGRPIGLIERNAFALKLAGQYGRSLYAGRPVTMLMDPEPSVVDGQVSIEAFTRDSLLKAPSELLHGFIVTRDGRYAGVGSTLSLLQAQNVSIRHHAAEAQAALRAKAEFLAVMSHEIRTPLNGVLTIAEVISRRLAQEELRPYVETIVSSGQTLLRLLNDALDLSRAEAGRLELQEDSFRLAGLIEDIDALWRPRALEAGLVLVTAFEAEDEPWVLGDAVRLKQVLNNLVGNAIKFTAAGSVEVRLRARVEDLHVFVEGEVVDTGPGISPDQIDGLFTPFGQTETGRNAGGAGLGLSICRQLIEKMGGSIGVRSAPGLGSVFAFEVTLFRTQRPGLEPAAPAPENVVRVPPARVLIADDNATNRMVAETLCRMFDCACESVENGAQAVELARSGRFDLVLMDIKMPVMDGLEATRRIRGLGAGLAGLPIIALTANADPYDAQAYLAQGVDAVVEKPIKPDALLAAMTRALAGGSVTNPSEIRVINVA